MTEALKDLAAAGVSVWLDDLSRPRIQTGSLAEMVERGDIVGITTNPTIFAKAIGAGSGYRAVQRFRMTVSESRFLMPARPAR